MGNVFWVFLLTLIAGLSMGIGSLIAFFSKTNKLSEWIVFRLFGVDKKRYPR